MTSDSSIGDLSQEDDVSYVGPRWDPRGRDDAPTVPTAEDESYQDPDDASEVSSTVCLPDDTIDVHRLLDLSGASRVCLVCMVKLRGTLQTKCVCSNKAGNGRHPGHNAKKEKYDPL